MWARASALRQLEIGAPDDDLVAVQRRSAPAISLRFSTRGRLLTMASMMMPKVVSIWVCL